MSPSYVDYSFEAFKKNKDIGCIAPVTFIQRFLLTLNPNQLNPVQLLAPSM
ncbi:hypothetical protein Back11_38020 [Paenibacillus baekrokdamisoli]|uniref:Uncharacterized protein n=1 Tax=Paenibacillus baekrokdamisoli TaxID=1712516 RepID=A0A3G9IUA0_9BACL|nr:hypothetical protein Back11_38020 [Paenibacillus baekrokdamisoli]